MPTTIQNDAVPFTRAVIEDFLRQRAEAGTGEASLQRYRSDMEQLLAYLGADGCIRPGTLLGWQLAMKQNGYAFNTVQTRLVTVNMYLRAIGRAELCLRTRAPQRNGGPELSWAEYRRMQDTAERQGNRRAWLFVTLLGEGGLPLHTMKDMTVEQLSANDLDGLALPEALRRPALDYAAQRGIREGAVFRTGYGNAISRESVLQELQRIGRDAGVTPDKATARCLKKLKTVPETWKPAQGPQAETIPV